LVMVTLTSLKQVVGNLHRYSSVSVQ